MFCGCARAKIWASSSVSVGKIVWTAQLCCSVLRGCVGKIPERFLSFLTEFMLIMYTSTNLLYSNFFWSLNCSIVLINN